MNWVTELSGAELRARLRQRGIPPWKVAVLVAHRDEPATVARPARILGS